MRTKNGDIPKIGDTFIYDTMTNNKAIGIIESIWDNYIISTNNVKYYIYEIYIDRSIERDNKLIELGINGN